MKVASLHGFLSIKLDIFSYSII